MIKRPQTLNSSTICIPTGYGKMYITISEHEGKPFEVFCSVGKSGQSIQAKAEVTGRLISLALRNEVPVKEVIDQILDIDGGNTIAHGKVIIKSIPDAVGKVLKEKYLMKGETECPTTTKKNLSK